MENYDKKQFENTENQEKDIDEAAKEQVSGETCADAETVEEETLDTDEAVETEETDTDAETDETAAEEGSDEVDDEVAERTATDAEKYSVIGADDEEIAEAAERITGNRHSTVSTAAPIRTRSPEQNRNVTNGIPMRHSSIADGSSDSAEPEPTHNSKLFTIIIAAAIAVFVLIMGAIVGVNVFSINASRRPSDIDISIETLENAEAEPTVPAPVTEPTQYRVKLDFYERKDIELSTSEITLAKLLEGIGCILAEDEKTSVPLDTVIKEDMVITVDKYSYETVTVDEVIPHETETIETDLIMKGTENVTEGEDGAKTTEYTVEYVNGVEKGRTVVTETVTKEPVTEVHQIGVGGELVGADGKTYTYSMRKTVTARYYSLEGPTYFGYDADETVIVVDNKTILLGTKLYVKNDDYDFGVRTAADIAGSVEGDEIYIWISPSNPNYAALKAAEPHTVDIYYID